MYITAAQYVTLTGRPIAEATTLRIMTACKLLDSRIGNYAIDTTGYKISSTWTVWDDGLDITISQAQKDAVQLWVATMISYLVDSSGLPPTTSQNVKLGRFSVGKNSSSGSLLPDEMGFADNILVSSGLINRKVRSTKGIYRNEYGQFY